MAVGTHHLIGGLHVWGVAVVALVAVAHDRWARRRSTRSTHSSEHHHHQHAAADSAACHHEDRADDAGDDDGGDGAAAPASLRADDGGDSATAPAPLEAACARAWITVLRATQELIVTVRTCLLEEVVAEVAPAAVVRNASPSCSCQVQAHKAAQSYGSGHTQ